MKWKCVCAAACLAVPGGCAPGPLDDDYWPQPSPLGRDLPAVKVPLDPADDDDVAAQPIKEEPTGELYLRHALSLSLLYNPELAAFAWDIRAEEAAVIQAGLWPNPEIAVEVEDFGGTDGFGGFGLSETTIAIGQTILLGGKLEKRVALARLSRDGAGWDYEVARVAALTRVAGGFIETLAAQRRLALAHEIEMLSQRVFSVIGERVEAGRVSPVERTKAGVELAKSRLDRERAERELVATRFRLAANWGTVGPQFAEAVADFEKVQTPPAVAELAERVRQNPDLARWTTEMAARRAAVELARAEAVPDVTLFGGPKLLLGGDEVAFVAGFSMPIPLYDRNQGGILEARIHEARAQRLRDAVEVRVQAGLAAACQFLDAAYTAATAVRDEIEPGARSAFEAAEEAFSQGKIGALDLLDAQRTLIDARRQYIDALAAYHRAVIVVERLIGAPLHETNHQGGQR